MPDRRISPGRHDFPRSSDENEANQSEPLPELRWLVYVVNGGAQKLMTAEHDPQAAFKSMDCK